MGSRAVPLYCCEPYLWRAVAPKHGSRRLTRYVQTQKPDSAELVEPGSPESSPGASNASSPLVEAAVNATTLPRKPEGSGAAALRSGAAGALAVAVATASAVLLALAA